MDTISIAPPLERGPIRYRNVLRWLVMPPEGAHEQGVFERAFERKKEALVYQKRIKAKFPEQSCPLIDTGRWTDAFGRIIR
jgi:hypothetical protein